MTDAEEQEDLDQETQEQKPVAARVYDIFLKYGEETKAMRMTGFLGINDSYIAIMDGDGRMQFASPLVSLHHVIALGDIPPAGTVIN